MWWVGLVWLERSPQTPFRAIGNYGEEWFQSFFPSIKMIIEIYNLRWETWPKLLYFGPFLHVFLNLYAYKLGFDLSIIFLAFGKWSCLFTSSTSNVVRYDRLATWYLSLSMLLPDITMKLEVHENVKCLAICWIYLLKPIASSQLNGLISTYFSTSILESMQRTISIVMLLWNSDRFLLCKDKMSHKALFSWGNKKKYWNGKNIVWSIHSFLLSFYPIILQDESVCILTDKSKSFRIFLFRESDLVTTKCSSSHLY